MGVVVELGVDRRGDLVEHEAQAADEHRIENEHLVRGSVCPFQLEPDVHEVTAARALYLNVSLS